MKMQLEIERITLKNPEDQVILENDLKEKIGISIVDGVFVIEVLSQKVRPEEYDLVVLDGAADATAPS